MSGLSGKLSFWIILIKPVGGFLITLSLSTEENAIKQKQTRLNLFIIRWASWYWPVRPGKYYSSGEREKSQELVISFPKKFDLLWNVSAILSLSFHPISVLSYLATNWIDFEKTWISLIVKMFSMVVITKK